MSLTTSFSLLFLRLVTAGSLLYFRVWEEAKAGYARIWKEEPWPLIEQIRDVGFPQPVILAFTGAAVAFLAACLLVVGLVTRIASGAMILILIFVLIADMRIGGDALEVCLLYGICCFVLMVHGPGRIAVDGFLSPQPIADY